MLVEAANTTSSDGAVWAAVVAVLVASMLTLFAYLIKSWIQAPIVNLTHEMREYNRRLTVLENWRIIHVERTHGTRSTDRQPQEPNDHET